MKQQSSNTTKSINQYFKKVKTICCQRIIRKVSPPGQTAVPPSHCLLSPPLLSSLPLSGPLPPTPSSPLAMVLNNSAPRRSLLHPAPAHYWRALTNTSALIPAHYVILATFLSLPHTPPWNLTPMPGHECLLHPQPLHQNSAAPCVLHPCLRS